MSEQAPSQNSQESTPPAPEPARAVAQVAAPALPDRPFDEATASLVELKEVARLFAAAGTFKGVTSPATAFAQMLVGRDLKIPMTKALTDVTMIQGKPTLSANLMAGMIKASGKYRFTKRAHTDQECSVEVYERVDGRWESLGVSTFTIKDAERAGLLSNPTWKKFPKNMLFSRVISNVAKQECGDVFLGSVYTPDELDPRVEVDEDGDPVPPKVGVKVQAAATRGTDAPPPPDTVDAEFVEASPDPAEETVPAVAAEVEALARATQWDLAGFLKQHRLTRLTSLDLTSLKNTRRNLRERQKVMAGSPA